MIPDFFTRFPKQRIALPPAMQAIYEHHYQQNRAGQTPAASMAQRLEAWMHRRVAADVQGSHQLRTLEIGAGNLNQLRYEQSSHYDIIEPFTALYADSPDVDQIQHIFSDIDEVPANQSYDRITSVATLEHIVDLPKVVAKAALLLTDGGSFRSAIPNEGTFLWRWGWQVSTGLEFWVKHRMDYGLLMQHEHVNTAQEIEEVLQYFFKDNPCRVFGLSRKIGLYRFYDSRHPNLDHARFYLDWRASQTS